MRNNTQPAVPSPLMFASAKGTILDSKWSNRWGRYEFKPYLNNHWLARRKNRGYTGAQLREIRKTHR